MRLSFRLATACFGSLAVLGCRGDCRDVAEIIVTEEDAPTTATLHAITYREFYEDERPTIAVGDSGAVLVRRSGGHWDARASGTDAALHAIAFADDSTFVAVAVGAGGAIVRTVDGGESWDRVDPGSGADLHAVVFGNFSGAVAVGEGIAVRSEDQGGSWTPVPLPEGAGTFRAVAAHPRLVAGNVLSFRALAVGDAGRALLSDDEGRTWSPVAGLGNADLRAVANVMPGDEQEFMIADADGTLRIVHDGLAVSVLELSSPSGFVGLSAQGGWLLAADGAIDVLLPDGQSNAHRPGESPDLLAIAGDYSTAFTVGARGTILRVEFAQPNCVPYY